MVMLIEKGKHFKKHSFLMHTDSVVPVLDANCYFINRKAVV